MKKILRPLFIGFLILILVALSATMMVWLKRDQIKQYAIQQINTELTAPVAVQSIGISFWSQFPRVSLTFNEVRITDPLRPKQFLLEAKRIFVAFNIWDILKNNYQVKLIEADSGRCRLFEDANGKVNYMITKPSTDQSSPLLLSLNEVKLSRFEIEYNSLKSRQLYHVFAHQLKCSGSFESRKEVLTTQGEIMVYRIQSGETKWMREKFISVDIGLTHSTNQLSISPGTIKVGSLLLNATGTIQSSGQPNDQISLQIDAEKASIASLLELLPGQFSSALQGYESDGNIYFKGSITGKTRQPAISFDFGIENGSLRKGNMLPLTAIECKGSFTNGIAKNMRTSKLQLPTLTLKLGEGSWTGSLLITDFNDPFIDASFKGNATLQDVLPFMESKTLESANGNIKADFHIAGKLASLQKTQQIGQIQSEGIIELDAAHIRFAGSDKPIDNLTASLYLNQSNLEIRSLKLQSGKSDVQVSGTFNNLLPYLFSNDQQLIADITYRSDQLDLRNMALPVMPGQQSETFTLPVDVVVNAALDIGTLSFDPFNASNLKGRISWKGKQITANELSAQTMNGKVTLNGIVNNTPAGDFKVQCIAECSKVDITELFRQCNNFGQQEITYQQLRGQLTSNIDFSAVWNSKLQCDLNTLLVSGSIQIANGQLLNYKPLEALSKYVRLDDLRDLRFAELKNTISIQSQTIYIPSMDMNNNALNVNIAGTHTFENLIDYHIRIKLSDLLAKKYKSNRTNEFEEEQTEGGTNLYLRMKGNASNPEFSYDKKQVREKAKADLIREKETIKKIWKKELGIEKDEDLQKRESNTQSDELEFEPE